jgi:hypothetical protein
MSIENEMPTKGAGDQPTPQVNPTFATGGEKPLIFATLAL